MAKSENLSLDIVYLHLLNPKYLFMKRIIIFLTIAAYTISSLVNAQDVKKDSLLIRMANMPIENIHKEYPNKPGHTYKGPEDVGYSPKDLHPAFYGCFDWHSSVHSHWMLVRVLRLFPEIPTKHEILKVLGESFMKEKLLTEAEYFKNNPLFERTYGWAWLLKLDEELMRLIDDSNDEAIKELASEWRISLSPLVDQIVNLWKVYLPKMTYPNRVGTHTNSAFALVFTIDWAKKANDRPFFNELKEKAIDLYMKDKSIPAHLEPNGSDFLSPSLETAYLMTKVLSTEEFTLWFDEYFEEKGLKNLLISPTISDLNDYQIVHLVGLSFSRSWCLKAISKSLPEGHPYKQILMETSKKMFEEAIPKMFASNYGGDHWLASFAVYAMQD